MSNSHRSLRSCILATLVIFSSALTPVVGQQKKLTGYVDPFLGTAPLLDESIIGYHPPEGWRVWAGLTFPGSSVPNAMVQLSPVTEYRTGSGYEFEDSTIYGFTHTNKGHWNLCNVPVLPVRTLTSGSAGFESSFRKKTEQASPSYYAVTLDKYDVRVELTSTLHCGIHRYTYTSAKNRAILFDLGRANNEVRNWNISQLDDHSVEGVQDMGGDQIYFYAQLNATIADLQLTDSAKQKGHALVVLADGGSKRVEMRIALSFVSTDNAKANLDAETSGRSFEKIHATGVAMWENLLNKIQVKGGTEFQRRLFYSSLYRSFLWPALRSDVNGEYRNESREVVNTGIRYYTIPSLWDTYRNKLVLLGLLQPEVTTDVIKSLIDRGEVSGYIPTFFHGDHAASFIAGSYARGITGFDAKKALQLLIKNATEEEGPRPHIKEYIEHGYISEPVVENPRTETVTSAGVSKTMEFAYDDYSVASLAAMLGEKETQHEYLQRSKNYRNVFDPASRFMRGRLADGTWVTPFNPQIPYYEYMYREANGWQLGFYAPHDMEGLTELYGGPGGLENKLDSFFTTPWNPKYIARNISGFIGQYCHGNQPDHEAPYAYYFAGKPEKSQAILDKILNQYYGIGEGEHALCGMDDAGEMSSWYVFAAMGIYPLSATDPRYIVSVPLFDEVSFQRGKGQVLKILYDKKSRKLSSIHYNDQPITDYFISDEQVTKGGTLRISTR